MATGDSLEGAGGSEGFRRMFAPGRLTLGVFFPIEAFPGDRPTMRDQERLARRAEELGFAALGVRDVPLCDPSFGDVGLKYARRGAAGVLEEIGREILPRLAAGRTTNPVALHAV